MPAGYRDRREREEQEREREEQERRELEEYYRTRETPEGDPSRMSGGSEDFLTGIPLVDELGGGYARASHAQNEGSRASAESLLNALRSTNPSIEDLTPDYYFEGTEDEYGDLLGDPSAFDRLQSGGEAGQQYAMQALRSLYEQGGYTDADRAASRAMRGQQAQQLGAANLAALQQAQARGMGGSGAELAARMGAGEAMAYANSQNDAAIQQAAMQRALQSLQGYGDISGRARGQDYERFRALDDFNKSNMDWRRDREKENTRIANIEEEKRAQAHQTQYDNSATSTRMGLDMYAGNQNQQRADWEMESEAGRRQVDAAAEGFGSIAGGWGGRR